MATALAQNVPIQAAATEKSTLVVEDGSGKGLAQSYLSLTDATDRIRCFDESSKWKNLGISKKNCTLFLATAYLDTRFRWYGSTRTNTQGLQWPRTRNFDNRGFTIDAGTIPEQLKDATARVAAAMADNDEVITGVVGGSGAVSSWGSDGVSVSFDSQTAQQNYLLGTRFVDVELGLRSIGLLKDLEFLEQKKRTFLSE